MKDTISKILKGEITRENDGKRAGGFYDIALDIVDDLDLGRKITAVHYDETVDAIYSALWECFEETKKQDREAIREWADKKAYEIYNPLRKRVIELTALLSFLDGLEGE